MSALVLTSRRVVMDHAMEHVEITLLMFFLGLFMVVGGVEHSQFLEYVGSFITPFVEADLLTATIVLMWIGAFLSAAIDNIPFTAAMIPIILGMEQQGINVSPLWWGLAMGVGLGGNGTHIGSTANVFIVTISERLAREENDRSLAITPGLWFKKGLAGHARDVASIDDCLRDRFSTFSRGRSTNAAVSFRETRLRIGTFLDCGGGLCGHRIAVTGSLSHGSVLMKLEKTRV